MSECPFCKANLISRVQKYNTVLLYFLCGSIIEMTGIKHRWLEVKKCTDP